jgi:hypothetical protein
MQASGAQTMPRDARIDVEDMDHSNLNIVLECIAAIAAKARTLASRKLFKQSYLLDKNSDNLIH